MTAVETNLDCTMGNAERIAADLTERVTGEAVIRCHEPLAKRTTLRVGGPADVYVEPASEADLASVFRYCAANSLPHLVLGRGSNLLVRDGGIRGVVISLAHASFSRIEVDGERLRCGAGARLKNVAVEARRNGLGGVEFLEGIPGSVGGALRMNAGAMGGDTFNVVESVRVMDIAGRIHEIAAKEIQVQYRCCPLLIDRIGLGAVFKCTSTAREEIERRMSQYNSKRWETQPAKPSAGCTFKNPTSIPAGRLIDELGLKGRRIGDAMVSMEHGNFIVNDGKATAHDVLELIELIKSKAMQERGVVLNTEVEIVGVDAVTRQSARIS